MNIIGDVKVETSWYGRQFYAKVLVVIDKNNKLKLIIGSTVIEIILRNKTMREADLKRWKTFVKDKAFMLSWAKYSQVLNQKGVVRTQFYEPSPEEQN